MKNTAIFACLFLGSSQIGFTQNLEIDYDESNNSVALTWDSVVDRTYFLQVSDSLDDWDYAPLIWYGDGTNLGTNVSVTPGVNLFYRLVHTDYEVTGGNPGLADFDLDGLTNSDEITGPHGTSPFSGDTDRDWLTDADEILWNLTDPIDPDSDADGIGDGNEDFDNDGWKNWRELAMVSPPTIYGTSAYDPDYVFADPPTNQIPALRFRCLPGPDHGYHYRVQGSPNLFTWEDINHYENGYGPALPSGTLGTADTDPVLDGTGAHEFTVGVPATSNYQFLRLKVEEPFPGHDLRTDDTVTPQTLKAHSDAHFDKLVPDNEFSRQLFDYYDKDEDCIWSKWCWTNQVDFTGTAWEDDWSWSAEGKNVPPGPYSNVELTLLSPRHVVGAAHHIQARILVNPYVGTGPIDLAQPIPVTFFDSDGNQVIRNLTRFVYIGCDMVICLLDEPVPPKVKVYKVLPPRYGNGDPIDWAALLDDARTLNTVRERESLLYKVRSIGNCRITYGIRPEVPMCYRSERAGTVDLFIGGDSGNPQFVFVRGEPILLGILEFPGSNGNWPGGGPFFSDSENFSKTNQAMRDLGGDYSLQTVDLF
jgi:hypothetical protein